MTAKDISKLIIPKQPKALAAIQAQEIAAMKDGGNGFDFKKKKYRNDVKATVNTREIFNDLTHTAFGNYSEDSYAEALGKPSNWSLQMFASIKNLDGIKDTDGKDGITRSDFEEGDVRDVENMRILREEMLNYENIDARDLFTEWLVAAGEKSYKERYSIYDAKVKAAAAASKKKAATGTSNVGPWLGSGNSLSVQGGDRYVSYAQGKVMYDSLLEAVKGKSNSMNFFNTKYSYDHKSDSWSTGTGEDKIIYGTTEKFVKSLGISHPDFTSLKSGTEGVDSREYQKRFLGYAGFTPSRDPLSPEIQNNK